jgi:hypothetical protein
MQAREEVWKGISNQILTLAERDVWPAQISSTKCRALTVPLENQARASELTSLFMREIHAFCVKIPQQAHCLTASVR